jgi:hypothetical protein
LIGRNEFRVDLSSSKIKLLHPVNGNKELLTIDSMDNWDKPEVQGRCKILQRKLVANYNLSSWMETEKHKLADRVSWGNSVTHLGMTFMSPKGHYPQVIFSSASQGLGISEPTTNCCFVA